MSNPIPPYALFAREVFARPSLSALVNDPDDWQTLQDAHRRATEALSTPAASTEGDVIREVNQALRTGETYPADFAERLFQANQAAEIRRIERTTLERLRNGYATELVSIAEDSTDEMIEALDAELQGVINRGAERIGDLGGIVNPLDAIQRGQADAFREVAELHQTYLRVRSDADIIHRHLDAAVINGDPGHRLMRHVARVWPSWWDAANEAAPLYSLDRSAPWPSDLDSLEFFVWLVDHREEAEPWVPTIQAMRDAQTHDASTAYAVYQERHRIR